MKKITYAIELFLIILFFIVPPIFMQNPINSTIKMIYPMQTFVTIIFGIVLYLQIKDKFIPYKEISFFKIAIDAGKSLLCLGTLLLSAAVLESLSFLILKKTHPTEFTLIAPKNFLQILNFLIGTFGAAFYEEVLYRLYLPEEIKFLAKINSPFKKRIFDISTEILCVIIFALGHLYLGILGVANAIIGGTALRICVKKTCGIWAGFFAHAAFNFLNFLWMYLLYNCR
ncbi:CPBP family intramembrane glutamic endopeptidase [Treponema zioleckii]|uniref:CPBP family intramembrane glutamic endopeptidase n=1 Tax=Treponema zioleckii TaxID=331680 RepID=UPI00168AD49C|nr:CPBP family intramembrane glutamic endopeptidase [Treponema zioleckii]